MISVQSTRSGPADRNDAVAPNHTAASKKNTAGPVVGTRAPHGQAITAIATAIAKCNPWLTINVHGRRFGDDCQTTFGGGQHEQAGNHPTKHQVMDHAVRPSRPKRRNRSELVTTLTEENPIAAPATTGFSAPSAASGIAAVL